MASVTNPGEASWERSERLDPDRAAARIADVEGVRLKIEGPCRGGEVGAFYVRWPDGRPGVLTMGRPESAPLAAAARAAGIPAPSYDLAVTDSAVTDSAVTDHGVSIRHHTSADVDFWLGVVEPGLK
jgi:hypothetical protein